MVAVTASLIAACGPGTPADLRLLLQDAQGPTHTTRNPLTGTPSFLRTQVSATAMDRPFTNSIDFGRNFMRRYA